MKILITTDGSENSLKAINWTMEKMARENDQVILMTVSQFAQDLLAEMPPSTQDKLEAIAGEILDKGKNILKDKGIEPQIVLEVGTVPANNIIRRAEDEKVDIIVMGSTGLSGLKKTLLGSTASKVVGNAPCSVCIIR